MARKFDAGYYFSEGFHSIFTHGFMSFAAVCMIVACLLIMGSFTLLAVNLDNMLGDMEQENELAVYVDDSYTEESARALEPALLQVPNVTGATFMTRAEALEEFKRDRGNVDILEDLPDDVLRDRYYVRIADIEQMAQTKANLEQVEGVGDVVAAVEIAEGFVLVRNVATGVALVLVGILLVVSLFIIANTIKLATFYRRDEIAIMKMCGATDGFIRWPFVVEGLVLGLTACTRIQESTSQDGSAPPAVSTLAPAGEPDQSQEPEEPVYPYAAPTVYKTLKVGNGLSLVTMIPYTAMVSTILPVFCAVGAVIGVGGSLVAIRKFLQV